MQIDLSDIKDLIQVLSESPLSEIHLEHQDFKLSLKKASGPVAALPAPVVATAAPLPEPVSVAAVVVEAANELVIRSPMVGTFYRAPSPDARPFVEVGDQVSPGQPVCIIEAMKLMNELESDLSGRVARFLVENGQGVEFGQPLLALAPV